MSIRLSIIGSVVLHGAAFSFLLAQPALQRPALPTVVTDQWVVDVSTVLLSDAPGTELPPREPAVIASHQEAEVSSPAQMHPDDSVPPRQEPAPVVAQSDKSLPAEGGGGGQPLSPEPAPWTAGPEGTAISRAFANTMNAQAIVAHLMQYRMTAVAHLKGGVGRALPVEERRALDRATGTVLVTFQDGAVASLSVETENDQLRSVLLERVDWSLLPVPRQFSLPISRVACTVGISNGKIRVGVGPI